MKKHTNTCKMCSVELQGRRDKVFCSSDCKNEYHAKLRKVNSIATGFIDGILHRNREILLEIMGKNAVQKKVSRFILDKKKFNYKYHTHMHTNSVGKTYYYVYDFGWMEFTDQDILIVRKKTRIS